MNRVGSDGQVMKCHTCGSQYHLKANCTRDGNGIRPGFITTTPAITDAFARIPQNIQENHSDVSFSFVVMLSEFCQETHGLGTHAFLNTEQKNHGECLLVDTGAFENLVVRCGSKELRESRKRVGPKAAPNQWNRNH